MSLKDKPLKKCHTDKRKMIDDLHSEIVQQIDEGDKLNEYYLDNGLLLDQYYSSDKKFIINDNKDGILSYFNKNEIDNPQNFYAMTKIMFKKSMSYYKKKNPKIKFYNIYIGDTYGSKDIRKKIFPTLIKNYKKNKRTTILTKKLKLNIDLFIKKL